MEWQKLLAWTGFGMLLGGMMKVVLQRYYLISDNTFIIVGLILVGVGLWFYLISKKEANKMAEEQTTVDESVETPDEDVADLSDEENSENKD